MAVLVQGTSAGPEDHHYPLRAPAVRSTRTPLEEPGS